MIWKAVECFLLSFNRAYTTCNKLWCQWWFGSQNLSPVLVIMLQILIITFFGCGKKVCLLGFSKHSPSIWNNLLDSFPMWVHPDVHAPLQAVWMDKLISLGIKKHTVQLQAIWFFKNFSKLFSAFDLQICTALYKYFALKQGSIRKAINSALVVCTLKAVWTVSPQIALSDFNA